MSAQRETLDCAHTSNPVLAHVFVLDLRDARAWALELDLRCPEASGQSIH